MITLFAATPPHPQELLAAREIRRYTFCSTGVLSNISLRGCGDAILDEARGNVVLLTAACARKARGPEDATLRAVSNLEGEALLVHHSVERDPFVVGGGSALGLLYGAYHFAEIALGVHFGIGGDICVQRSWAGYLADGSRALRERGGVRAPRFATRGLNPFHDFFEGPDLWEKGNYKIYGAQMAKLRLNVLVLHNYNDYLDEGAVYGSGYAEPTVWLGPPSDVDGLGHVHSSYANGTMPISWASTCISKDGAPPVPTRSFVSGAALLFGTPCVQERWQPLSAAVDTVEAHVAAFNDADSLFGDVFPPLRARGVKSAIGSEVPSAPPKVFNTTLVYLNAFRAPSDSLLTSGYYACEYSTKCDWMCGTIAQGRRLACAPEFDYQEPYLHHNVQGWVLANQAAGTLPLATYYNGSKASPGNTLLCVEEEEGSRCNYVPCCNYVRVRAEGYVYPPSVRQGALPEGINLGTDLYPLRLWRCNATSLDHGRARGDPQPTCDPASGDMMATSSPLLEQDAAAMGYVPCAHIGQVFRHRPRAWLQSTYEGALSRATRAFQLDYFWLWTQEVWNARDPFGSHGNASWAAVGSDAVQTAVDDFLALDGARHALGLSDSLGLVTGGWTLGPRQQRAYFDSVLPQGWALASLDELLGTVDVEPEYANVTRHPSIVMPWLEDDPHLGVSQLWVSRTLAHLEQGAVLGATGAVPITWRMEAIAPTLYAASRASWEANLTARQVWQDWSTGEFGLTSKAHADAFATAWLDLEGIEGNLTFVGCPGTVQFCSDGAAIDDVERRVLSLLLLAPLVSPSPEHADRWRKWSSLLTYTVAAARAACVADEYKGFAAQARALPPSDERRALANDTLLPLKQRMVAAATNLTTLLLEATDGPGEMGMLATLHLSVLFLEASDSPFGENLLNQSAANELEIWLGSALPPSARLPAPGFRGTERIVCLEPRSTADFAEMMQLSVSILSVPQPLPLRVSVTAFHRPLGQGKWIPVPMSVHGTQGQVYRVSLPVDAHGGEDFEYYIRADLVEGTSLHWPPGAPERTQTVVVMGGPEAPKMS